MGRNVGQGRPPYTNQKASGWYWEPRGRMATVSKPQMLGKDRTEAWKAGQALYLDCMAALESPTDTPHHFSIAWGAARWRESDDYEFKASGKPKAVKTIKDQEDGLKLVETKFGRQDLRALERRDVKGWRTELRQRGQPSTMARALRTLRMLYAYFIDEGWYPGSNPAARMKIHVPERDYTPWRPDRVGRFVRQAIRMDEASIAIGVMLIYDTSQNPSDVLSWRRKPHFADGAGIDLSRNKTGVLAYVPLRWMTRALMRKHPTDSMFLVAREGTGQPYKYDYFAKRVQAIRKAAGLPDELKVGNLRHEAAQEARDAGTDDTQVRNLLAHKSISTQSRYAKPGRADGAQAARERARRERRNRDGG